MSSKDTVYPAAIDDPVPAAFLDNFDESSWHATGQGAWLARAVIKLQTVLGISPAAGYADVATRLAAIDATDLGEVVTTADAIVASPVQTQLGATALTHGMNRVVTVVTPGDAVVLPAAIAGRTIKVIDAHLTNGVGVFPASGDAIDALGADTVYVLAATVTAEFNCAVDGIWNSK